MRVNDEARKSVVFFGVPSAGKPEEIEYRGTGFMLCDFEDGILIPYIVTAGHVAQKLEKFRDTGFYLRANRKDGGDPLMKIEQADWAYHPDPTVDLAVANLSFSGAFFDIIYWPLRDKFFGDEDRVAKFGGPNDVLCGDPVSIIGLFRLHPELFTPGMWQHFPMPASASRSWMRQAIKLRPKPILWRRRPLRV
jgi:hypothetical protein